MILERLGGTPVDVGISQGSILGLPLLLHCPLGQSHLQKLQSALLYVNEAPTHMLALNPVSDLQTRDFCYIIDVSLVFHTSNSFLKTSLFHLLSGAILFSCSPSGNSSFITARHLRIIFNSA